MLIAPGSRMEWLIDVSSPHYRITQFARKTKMTAVPLPHNTVTTLLFAAALGVAASTPSVEAQERVDISFEPGASSTTINGTIVGDEYSDHILGARAGQTIAVSLAVTATNGNGSAFFNILPAGQDYPALYNGSTDDDRRAEVTLPESGDWAIRVYLMGNDRDAGKTVGYSIDVDIGRGKGSQGAGSSGGGNTMRVTDVPDNDVLNARSGPGTDNRIIGALANGDSVRVLGCENVGNSRWCEIEMMTDMRERGWVNARYLTGEASARPTPPPSQSPEAPANLPLFGQGYPNPGDPCRQAGESSLTNRYLDDAADLVACPPNTDAGLFAYTYNATQLERVQGWILFSVPRR
jgi:uncharacterized protein YgiM (DUF1202 family)